MPGRHNVENAVAACAIAYNLGLNEQQIRSGLQTYTGVKRRFDLQFKAKACVYIDDYAHHPEELKACILSVKELYAGKKITGIFQPHLFSRTRDFADGFAAAVVFICGGVLCGDDVEVIGRIEVHIASRHRIAANDVDVALGVGEGGFTTD